jgi:hypothetical protein
MTRGRLVAGRRLMTGKRLMAGGRLITGGRLIVGRKLICAIFCSVLLVFYLPFQKVLCANRLRFTSPHQHEMSASSLTWLNLATELKHKYLRKNAGTSDQCPVRLAHWHACFGGEEVRMIL